MLNQGILFLADNPVLWVRSETIGYSLNPGSCWTEMAEYRRSAGGGLELWNTGMMACPGATHMWIAAIHVTMARISL